MKATSTFSACVLFVGAFASPLFAQFSGGTTLTSEEFNIRSTTTITYQETIDEFYFCSFGCTFAAHHFLGHGTDVNQDNGSGAQVNDTYKFTSLLYQTKYPGSCYSSHSWASFDTHTGSRRRSPDYYAPENGLCVPMPPDPPPPPPGGGGCEGRLLNPADDCSPIVINFGRGNYRLTGANSPVLFDIAASGSPALIGWTASGADEAFLWLDRNHNGVVDNGAELFGNATPQVDGKRAPNGFEALRVFDTNHDGIIDEHDSIWPQLLLWRDLNHDGVSQSSETGSVIGSGFTAISLDYHRTGRRDEFGNTFRYESQVWIRHAGGQATPEPVYDIFFVPVP